jgi:signal transduction histidine kinase/CheY-like chemotaxis protein
MLAIRSKVLLVIFLIVFLITLSSLGVSFIFSQDRFMDTIKKDLTTISKIAEELVANEIKLIKEQTRATANLLSGAANEEYPAILEKESERYHYLAMTILDVSGVVASHGFAVDPQENLLENPFFWRAYSGETVMSTTIYVQGELVIRVWAQVNRDLVVVATVPGLFLCDLLTKYRIWETGALFIFDAEGTVIAYFKPETVLSRWNYKEDGKETPATEEAVGFFDRMLQSENGINRYTFDSEEFICAYIRIAGSNGWTLGAAAPLKESPLAQIYQVLSISALVFLVLGLLVAAIASNSIVHPFLRINEQNVQLERLKAAAESASKAKSDFLANMSHEMRTPLNAIIGLSELELGTAELPQEVHNNLEKIYGSGIVMLGIINDILDISKIESGKLELIPVEYEVPSLINDTVSINSVRIGSKPIEFRLHVDEGLPFRLFGDELRIKQIFNNLLSNAFKYTERGCVYWYLSSEAESGDIWIRSVVKDTGIGIQQEDIPRLFTDYNQVNTKSNRIIEGTGLGLSITKRLVELMGGEISVESEYGKGSAFTVRFRQYAVDIETIGKDIAQNLMDFRYTVQQRHDNERFVRSYIPYATVLVVDDVPTNLDVAKGMMKSYGMRIDCVSNGQAAIDLVRNEEFRYNAIFMDHMMPGMDGIEAVRIIREEINSDYAKSVPIIALTANAIIGNEAMFLSNGFQGFLSKPIDILRLDKLINDFVRDKEREKELKLPVNAPPSHGEQRERGGKGGSVGGKKVFRLPRDRKIPGLDVQQGLARYSGDEGAYLPILRSYMNNTPTMLKSLRDVNAETLPLYAIAVHGIKGSSYGISAGAVGRQAEALEAAAKSGNLDFIQSNNDAFIEDAEALIQNLRGVFERIDQENQKLKLSAPSPELLAEMLIASRDYDIEALDSDLSELEKFRYESGEELVEWLHEQIGKSEFGAIEKRLAEEVETGGEIL